MSSLQQVQSLILNDRVISYVDILSGKPETFNEFEKGILNFSKKWLSEDDTFSQQTSGSTGTPKTITMSREIMCKSIQLTQQALNLKKGDNALVCLSADYIAGKMMLARAFELQMTITVVDPGYFKKPHYSSLQPHFLAIVPMQADLITSTTQGTKWLKHINNVIIGGAPIGHDLRDRLTSLTSANIFETYGMTETTSHVALKNISNRSTSFEAVANTRFDIDDRSCLKIKSILTQDEWMQTNDCVNLLSPTQFEWLGRADFIINSGGIKIQPEVLEQKILKLISGQEIQNRFFITGLPDEKLGQIVTLFVEGPMDKKLDFEGVLDGPEKPKRTITIERFKETASGKVDRLGTISSGFPAGNSGKD